MVYLIVGLDRSTFAPWHSNVMARDAATAAQIAGARATADGIALGASTNGREPPVSFGHGSLKLR